MRSRDLDDLPLRWAQHPLVIGDRWRWHRPDYIATDEALVVAMAARAGHAAGRRRSITALGEPEHVARLLTGASDQLLAGTSPHSASMPPGTWELLPADHRGRWDLPRHGRWDWMWACRVPAVHRLEHRVVRLSVDQHHEQIRALQTVALPGTHFGPDRPGSTWFGIWRTDAELHVESELIAVAGSYDWVHAVHLGGIGTHPELRGAGLGGALTAAITRAAVTRFGRVSLGVYADNLRAKALYARLGYVIGQEVDSRHAA